ncbi:MAG: hypothetical protein NTV25_09655 [Methanothrix sp.]|nr:hypothetical protein [Methanothrix sp.]
MRAFFGSLPKEARSVAEAWKGWRGLASFYLIMAERLKIEV